MRVNKRLMLRSRTIPVRILVVKIVVAKIILEKEDLFLIPISLDK